MPKPSPSDYPEYFGRYISQVKEDDILQALNNQEPEVEKFLHSVDDEKANYAYAPGKWTLKELLQHVIDTERIFQYRALCISRKEPASLLPFDENLYAENADVSNRKWNDLTREFMNVRQSTADLFNSFSEKMWTQQGLSGNNPITVLSLGFIIIGHVYHHIKIVNERYLVADKQ